MSQSMNKHQNERPITWPVSVNCIEPTPISESGVRVVDHISMDDSILLQNEDLLQTFLYLFSRSSERQVPSLQNSAKDDTFVLHNWYDDHTILTSSSNQSTTPNNELFSQKSDRLDMMPRSPDYYKESPQHHAFYNGHGQDQSHDFCVKTKPMMESRYLGETDEASLPPLYHALHNNEVTAKFPVTVREGFRHQQPHIDCTTSSHESTAFGVMKTSSHRKTKASSKTKVGRYHIELWNAQFVKLVEFKRIHGHSDVPCTWSEDRSLSHWVRRQRHQYKLKAAGGHNTLSSERQEALESIGFVWDPNSSVWDERYEELVKFHRVHGHCRVPRHRDARENNDLAVQPKHKQGDILATWVKCQRQQYRHNQLGIKTALTRDRIARLDQLGFSWTVLGGSSSPEHLN